MVCSCATGTRVLSMVLHAVRNWLAAVRAHLLQDQEMLITATRMLCGQVHLPQVAVTIMFTTIEMAVSITRLASPVTFPLLQSLCAVSWIWRPADYWFAAMRRQCKFFLRRCTVQLVDLRLSGCYRATLLAILGMEYFSFKQG